jgi:tRNA A-37 threonylcarbamoyl transferase component Bud32
MTAPFGDPAQPYRERLARALQPTLRLGRLIGRGGFAEVYAAWDEQLKRDVAVKVLRYDLAQHETLITRFRREAEAVAQLQHPNIVPIYGIGDGEGLVYFTMPLVRGETLARHLERVPLPRLDEVRRILVAVADALHAAHRAGIVHRDIKPENIMLEGEDDRVLVMDFGIAKAAASDDRTLTAAGMVVGTPQYMSPEQASGEGRVDARSDIYSLGVVAYQMVTGRVPFGGGSAIGVLIRHATERPPPIANLRPECPPGLASAITRCLEKDPALRWQTSAEFRDAVRAGGDAGPAPAVRPRLERPTLERDRRIAARARAVVVACLVVAVATLALDLLPDGSLQFAPFVLVLAALVVTLAFGQAIAAGVPLRAVARPRRLTEDAAANGPRGPQAPDQREFGAYAETVRQARTHRATLVALLARMPAAERRVLGDVLPIADRVLSETTELARQAQSLERALTAAGSADERRQLSERRASVTHRLDSGVREIFELRAAVRLAAVDGLGAAGTRLRSIIGRSEA